jgi:Fe-S oxidoreductase
VLRRGLPGIELVEPARSDERCGFGGTFVATEDAVSCAMGHDRLAAHERAGAEIVNAADMPCLMHLGGLIRRDRRPLVRATRADFVNKKIVRCCNDCHRRRPRCRAAARGDAETHLMELVTAGRVMNASYGNAVNGWGGTCGELRVGQCVCSKSLLRLDLSL